MSLRPQAIAESILTIANGAAYSYELYDIIHCRYWGKRRRGSNPSNLRDFFNYAFTNTL
ncbi:MAG: hypothetical protein AB4206_15880 [Xenococcaceae cyanobacterium]